MTFPFLKAVIFDMDGVLINSEPAWQTAEYQTMKNLGLNISYIDTLQTTGLRIDQVVNHWYQRFPWKDYNNNKTAKAITDQVTKHILSDGIPMKGVFTALNFCKLKGIKNSAASDRV